jgi:hypothetical protein
MTKRAGRAPPADSSEKTVMEAAGIEPTQGFLSRGPELLPGA